MTVQDPTHADRQARYRARQATETVAAQARRETREEALLEAMRALTREVAKLTQAVEKAPRTVGKRHSDGSSDSFDSGASRDGRRAPARAREDVAPAPYGGVGATRDVTDDAFRVLRTMDGRAASVGSVRDAMGDGWDVARIGAALVYAQGHGQVRREPGEGTAPDRWVPTPDAIREEAAAPSAPALAVDQAPTLHVDCQDYQAHATAHAWDPALGAFVCARCQPTPVTA